jgi:hypothetical protein
MSYEPAIAACGGDDTTLAKSFIISLKNAAANWYARLPPRFLGRHHNRRRFFLLLAV